MKILVPVKRVVDYKVRIRVNPDQTGVVLDNVKMSMNPFDETAVEEAIRLKEAGKATDILAVSIGSSQAQETLRTALAMGADRALLVQTAQTVEPLAVAKILKEVVREENCTLVLMGKQAIDDDCNQTGQMLAALLGWKQATFASEIFVEGKNLRVVREVDGGHQTLAFQLPAVITADLRLNTPRYASLPNIMRARQKPLTFRPIETFPVDLTPRLETVRVISPPPRKAGVRLDSVETLIATLKTLLASL